MHLRGKRLHFVGIVLAGLLGFTAATSGLAEEAPASESTSPEDAVVRITVSASDGATLRNGTGFFLRPGLLVTDRHLLEGAGKVEFVARGGEALPVSGVAADDPEAGLVLLATGASGIEAALALQTKLPKWRDRLRAIALPVSGAASIEAAVEGIHAIPALCAVIRLTGSLPPDLTGAPVVDALGRVVGLAVVGEVAGQRRVVALPAERLAQLQAGVVVPVSEWATQDALQSGSDVGLVCRGLDLLRLDDYQAALKLFDAAKQRDAGHVRAWFYAGYARLLLEQPQAALADYQTVVRLRPDDPESHHALGAALAYLQRFGEAAGEFESALRLNSQMALAWDNLGIVRLKQHRFAEAAAAHEQAVRLMPDSAEAHLHLGLDYQELGRPEESVQLFRKALALKPDLAEAYLALGQSSLEAQQYQDALEAYQGMREVMPGSVEAHLRIGQALVELDRAKEAQEAFLEACTLEPDNALAFFGLGMAEATSGEYASAVEALKRARLLLQGDVPELTRSVNLALAECLFRLEGFEDALAASQEAVRLDPERAEALDLVGMCYLNLNRVHEAVGALEQAALKAPELPIVHFHLGLAYLADQDIRGLVRETGQLRQSDPELASELEKALLEGLAAMADADPTNPDAAPARLPEASKRKRVGRIVATVKTAEQALAIRIQGAWAYVAVGTKGLQIFSLANPAKPRLVGSVDTPGEALNLAVVGQYVYIADSWAGLQVIDVSDPASPRVVNALQLPGPAAAVEVKNDYGYDYLYVAGMEAGLIIVNITDPANPTLAATLDTPGRAQALAPKRSCVYVADGDEGLRVVDLWNIAEPRLNLAVPFPGESVRGLSSTTEYVYVLTSTRLVAYNTWIDPLAPIRRGVAEVPQDPGSGAAQVRVVGGWALIANNSKGLLAVDLSDPPNPKPMGLLKTPGRAMGVDVVGEYAFVADGPRGLTVVKLSL